MASIYSSVLNAVGDTPVVRLQRLKRPDGIEILAKLDYLNPGGSSKDRPLVRMIEEAEARGELEPGATIIESSSGNLAIALAMAGAVRGYRVICVVDPKLTEVVERMITALGGELEVVDQADESGSYLRSRLRRRDQLLEETPGSWCPDQYRNRASVRGHYHGTGSEIVRDLPDQLDALVVATGTGATISGCAKKIKEHYPDALVVAADALGSKIFDDQIYPWLQKGLGSGLPAVELANLDLEVVDEARLVEDEEAFMTARALARNEGILAGGSAGSAVFAALTLAREMKAPARIVTLLPDRMERYLYEHHADEWMRARGLSLDASPEAVDRAVQGWCSQRQVFDGPGNVPVHKRSLADAGDEPAVASRRAS